MQCSICLHADHGNQMILVHRYHVQPNSVFLHSRLVECDVTQPANQSNSLIRHWLMLKNATLKWCISQSQTALQLYTV